MHIHVVQMRGVELLQAAVAKHPTDASVLANSCRLIANLALTGLLGVHVSVVHRAVSMQG